MDPRLLSSSLTRRTNHNQQPVIQHGKTIQQLQPDSLTQPLTSKVLKGISPTDFYLLREDYPGYLPAKNHIMTDMLEHIKHTKGPITLQVWDGGSAADLAEDITHCAHNAAAEVLEPDTNYFQFLQRMLNTNPASRVVPKQENIIKHKYKGRFDVIASMFTVNRFTPNECRWVLKNVRQNGLMPDGLLYIAGQFMPDNVSRRDTARYYANVLFHCISHQKLQAAQLVLGDWYQAESRQGKTLMSSDQFEQILSQQGFHYVRERIWPNKVLHRQSVYPDDDSGVYVYKAWLAHTENANPSKPQHDKA
jgi:hypothetical protein